MRFTASRQTIDPPLGNTNATGNLPRTGLVSKDSQSISGVSIAKQISDERWNGTNIYHRKVLDERKIPIALVWLFIIAGFQSSAAGPSLLNRNQKF